MRRAFVGGMAILLCGANLLAQEKKEKTIDTRTLIEARKVTKAVRLKLNSARDKLTIRIDDAQDIPFRPVNSDEVFVTTGEVSVTYSQLNPLVDKVSVQSTDKPSSSVDLVASLLSAIAGIPGIVKPGLPTPSGGDRLLMLGIKGGLPTDIAELFDTPDPNAKPKGQCAAELAPAFKAVQTLSAALYSQTTTSESIRKEIASWAEAIDDAYIRGLSGREAVRAGTARIKNFEDAIGGGLDGVTQMLAAVDEGAKKTPITSCEEYATYVWQLVRLSSVQVRFAHLKGLQKHVADLRSTLDKNYIQRQWIYGSDFVVADSVKPSRDSFKAVVVSVSTLSVNVTPEATTTTTEKESASTSFSVHKYDRFVTETGVGATFAFVGVPKYGTGKNEAGETIVVRQPDDEVSINPSVMVNYICRCNAMGLLAPMLQIGASASKDVPAILVGAAFACLAWERAISLSAQAVRSRGSRTSTS